MTEQPQATPEPRRLRTRPKRVRLVVAMAPPAPLALAPLTTKATALRAFE